jgi:hypothetical protein
VAGSYVHGNAPLGSINVGEMSLPSECVITFRDIHCFMEVVCYIASELAVSNPWELIS